MTTVIVSTSHRPLRLFFVAAAVAAAFALQIAVLRHAGGLVLWALFAIAALAAWRANARRQEDARLLQAIVEGTSDAVFVKDLEGRYLLANDAAATLLGHPREAIIGRTDADLCGRDQAAARRARDEAVMAGGETAPLLAHRRRARHPARAVGGQGAVPRPQRASRSA